MAKSVPMPMCPMAAMCRGMIERRTSRFAMIIPSVVFILIGVIVFIEPQLLAWLVGIAFKAMGVFMLIMALVVRRVGRQF